MHALASVEPGVAGGGCCHEDRPLKEQPRGRKQKRQKLKQLAEVYAAAAEPEDANVASRQHADADPANSGLRGQETACEQPAAAEPARVPLLSVVEPPAEQPRTQAVGDSIGNNAVGPPAAEAAPPKRRRCGDVTRSCYFLVSECWHAACL